MRLIPDRLEVAADGIAGSAPVTSFPCTAAVDAVQVSFDVGPDVAVAWSVANRGDAARRIRSVALVFRLIDADEPVRLLRNGYQSWSPSGAVTFGVDRDPSTKANFEFLQGCHHADQRRVRDDDELRSEWVTLLRDADTRATGGQPVLLGFEASSEHDGTLRIRRGEQGIEVWAEAFLGDAQLAAGEQRPLHGILLDDRDGVDASAKLDAWAREVGRRGFARVDAPYQVGWCSWYHYFHDVTEDALRANLAHNESWPFDVFQLDDGFQSAIGDWLTTNDKFPSPLDRIAGDISAAGRIPGLWIAPFLVAPDSQVATSHPEWIARYRVHDEGTSGTVPTGPPTVDHGPLRAWWNPPWGGGDDGFMHALDTTNPEVLAHLEGVARDLVDAGFRYLKLDFTFAPSFDGGWMDPSRTPAQRVRAGYEAIRRGAGDDVFILGCGVPLGHVLGVVDANRIGQDVAPLWQLDPATEVVPGYLDVQPSTLLAYGNTVARSFMHRRLWLNDPDCIMLRTTETELAPEAARTWAHAVGVSGGMALVSDDLALLDADARALLDETLAIGRASDDAARTGGPVPHSDDLLDARIATHFRSRDHDLVVDPATGASTLGVVTGP